MRTVKMNKVVTAELFDKVISSAIKTEKLLAENGINMSELRRRNVIRINKSYKQDIQMANYYQKVWKHIL
jgi:hypothetical protein